MSTRFLCYSAIAVFSFLSALTSAAAGMANTAGRGLMERPAKVNSKAIVIWPQVFFSTERHGIQCTPFNVFSHSTPDALK